MGKSKSKKNYYLDDDLNIIPLVPETKQTNINTAVSTVELDKTVDKVKYELKSYKRILSRSKWMNSRYRKRR